MTHATFAFDLEHDARGFRRILQDAPGEHRTITDSETGVIYVLRHDDCRSMLTQRGLAGVGLALFDQMDIHDGPLREWYGSLMFTNEGSDHHRLRRLVGRAFTPKAVGAFRDRIAERVAERIAPLADGEAFDLLRPLRDVPTAAMCDLLGVPEADVSRFESWLDDLSPVFFFMTSEQIGRATAAIVALSGYVSDLCEKRSHEPREDLISALLRAEDDGDRLTRGETVAMVANLLVAGHDTTRSQIGATLYAMLKRPEFWPHALAGESSLEALVEETVRIEPGVLGVPRVAQEAVEVAGYSCQPGQILVASSIAANRDPAAWDAPSEIRLERVLDDRLSRHVSFGGGPHFCLGAWLARLTVQVVVSEIARFAPEPVDDLDGVEWAGTVGVAPVSLRARAAA